MVVIGCADRAAKVDVVGTNPRDGWRGPFYPGDLPKNQQLRYYATRLSMTEINGSFYNRTPTLEAVRAWRNDTPKDFVFTWKTSKFITQSGRP
jgi:uncharacterized protein YecE (DUF72 family)